MNTPRYGIWRGVLFSAFVVLVALGPLPTTAHADLVSWDGGGGADTDWTTDTNWSSNIEPGASDTAQFDRGAAFNYTVTFPLRLPFGGDITTDRLIVGSNSVTFANDRSNTNYFASEPTTRIQPSTSTNSRIRRASRRPP